MEVHAHACVHNYVCTRVCYSVCVFDTCMLFGEHRRILGCMKCICAQVCTYAIAPSLGFKIHGLNMYVCNSLVLLLAPVARAGTFVCVCVWPHDTYLSPSLAHATASCTHVWTYAPLHARKVSYSLNKLLHVCRFTEIRCAPIYMKLQRKNNIDLKKNTEIRCAPIHLRCTTISCKEISLHVS
jgi:hypothetical protein